MCDGVMSRSLVDTHRTKERATQPRACAQRRRAPVAERKSVSAVDDAERVDHLNGDTRPTCSPRVPTVANMSSTCHVVFVALLLLAAAAAQHQEEVEHAPPPEEAAVDGGGAAAAAQHQEEVENAPPPEEAQAAAAVDGEGAAPDVEGLRRRRHHPGRRGHPPRTSSPPRSPGGAPSAPPTQAVCTCCVPCFCRGGTSPVAPPPAAGGGGPRSTIGPPEGFVAPPFPSPSTPSSSDCLVALQSIIPCEGYLTGMDPVPPRPRGPCCSGLAGLLNATSTQSPAAGADARLPCLCRAILGQMQRLPTRMISACIRNRPTVDTEAWEKLSPKGEQSPIPLRKI
ncbi:hypothetical protein ACP70R_046798 [Stipagrostis hirtigluma subsp. patula]